MKVGDVVKYYFPNPKSLNKIYVLGIITYIGDSSIIIDCEDATKMKVSLKNFDRVELVKSVHTEKEKILA